MSNVLERYREVVWASGGRDYPLLDCYGLTRLARVEVFGRHWMALCSDAAPGDARAITAAVHATAAADGLAQIDRPRPGAVATAWRGRLCVHVGLVVLVDGSMRVLEIDKGMAGAQLTRVSAFEGRYSGVLYYDD